MELTSAVLIGIILGLTQVFKKAGLTSRYAPLVAVVIGIIANCGVDGFNVVAALSGIVYALIAMGIWSGTKTTFARAGV